ncbi:NERD domain-containing protein [Flavisolibacter sp. BT320]|nr:NERD domain-containing protein [Flavisolibacter longurius]
MTAIKAHLHKYGLDEFRSVKELVDFQESFLNAKQQIIITHSLLIEKEKLSLEKEIEGLINRINKEKYEIELELQSELFALEQQLDNLSTINSNIFQKCNTFIKKLRIKRLIKKNNNNFNFRVEKSIQHLRLTLTGKTNRYNYINSNFDEAIEESSCSQRNELERTKSVIDQISTIIHGAFGEQKVVTELKKLSDDYILINDFTFSFNPPIYYRQEDSYINSIQIDHLLIAPSGLFIIETKNWSKKSLENVNLWSPVQQIKRANFALFKLLSEGATESSLFLNKHHWGDRKITIKNLIVFINQKPNEEFQHVKVLTLKEVLGYIQYFKPSFSSNDISKVANYLLELNRKSQEFNNSVYY